MRDWLAETCDREQHVKLSTATTYVHPVPDKPK